MANIDFLADQYSGTKRDYLARKKSQYDALGVNGRMFLFSGRVGMAA